MKEFIKSACLLVLLCVASSSFSQQVLHLESEVAKSISAATYDHAKQSLMFFSGNNVFYYPISATKTIDPVWYTLDGVKKVDAALNWDDDVSLVFDGSTYRMFRHSTAAFVSENTTWPKLPAAWNNQLDGAVNWAPDIFLFCFNDEYVIYNTAADSVVAYSNLSSWQGWPAAWNNGIDDAFNIGDGYIYFLRAGEIMPYSIAEKSFFNPLPIAPVAGIKQTPGQAPSKASALSPALIPASFPGKTNNAPVADNAAPPTSSNNRSAGISNTACITGRPAGSGLSENQSPLQGDQSGRLYSDNLPAGHRITEVKIYSSKVWGKTVISGLQCILSSPDGRVVEQQVLGRKTISEYSFKLNENECIKGISGSSNGEQGNFIYSIQILTSARTSQVFGERMPDKVSQSFNLQLPDQSVFNGFAANFNTNISAVGLKYFGNSPMESSTNRQTVYVAPTNSTPPSGTNRIQQVTGYNPAANAESENTSQSPVQLSDDFLDNYEDYTKNLGNDNMWLVQPMPGLDWLGAGFDILRFDPLNPNETKNRKLMRGVVVTNSPDRGGNKAQYLKPYGTVFSSANSGTDVDSSAWVSSYKQFATSFSVAAGGSVKVPELGGSSMSGSYSEMSSTSVGSESIYYFSKVVRKIHELDLELTWRDQFTGQRYKQKLNPAFREDVANLPVMSGSVPEMSIYAMQKGVPLPAELERIKAKYLDLIAKYGTHFSSHVSWGGQYIARTQIKRSDYETSRMNKVDFQAAAEVTIKKVKVGGEVKFGTGEGQSTGTNKSVFRRQIYVQGGNGETDEDKWRDKVDLTPAPVEIFFTPYADLLVQPLFPNDANIEKKSKLLKIFTEKYLVDNMRPPVESKNDFFRELPDLAMPGMIYIKDGGGFDMQFSITFELNGKIETRESGRFSLGRTMHIEVPVDSKNIKLKAEYFTGWLNDTKVIFEKTFAAPELKCYSVWGTIISQGYEECKQ